MTPASTPTRSSSRPRLKFTLGTLLLVIALLVAIVSHVTTSSSLRQAQARLAAQQGQIQSLREQAGMFEVGDRTRIHVRSVSVLDEFTWKWQVYLPPTKREGYRLAFAVDNVPAEGLQCLNYASMASMPTGQPFTIEAGVRRRADGRWELVARRGLNRHQIDIAPTHALIVPADVRATPQEICGCTSVESLDALLPVVLLRLRAATGKADEFGRATASVGNTPCDGVIIWLEPIPNYEAAVSAPISPAGP